MNLKVFKLIVLIKKSFLKKFFDLKYGLDFLIRFKSISIIVLVISILLLIIFIILPIIQEKISLLIFFSKTFKTF